MTERTVDPRLLERARHCTICHQVVSLINRGADKNEALLVGLLAASQGKDAAEQLATEALANAPVRTLIDTEDR